MLKIFRSKKAFSLVEIVIALAIFMLVFSSVSFFAIDSLRASQNSRSRIAANLFIQETLNAIIINKNDLWITIINNTEDGPKHVVYNEETGKYDIADGPITQNDVTISFTIEQVGRDSFGIILDSGGNTDLGTREIVALASWEDIVGQTQQIESSLYINDWFTESWSQTLQDEFNNGTNSMTFVDNLVDGEVRLESVVYADWCRPEFTFTEFDLPGNGVAKTISANQGDVFMGTGDNASGLSLIKTTISDSDTPSFSVDGTFDGHKVNNVFGEGNYAYLATDTNSKEIVIIDISTTPYKEVGYFDAPGSNDGESVYVSGNYGYMTQGEYLRVFNLTSKIGSRPQVAQHKLYKRGTFMEVKGNYAYILIAGAVEELEIVNISNPLSPQTVGNVDVNSGVAVTALNVSDDEQRIYIGANSSANFRELYIVDISNKNGTRPIIGEYEAGGLSVRAIEVVDNDTKVILVGTNGEEYQVVDTTNAANPVRCGGLQIASGGNAIAAVVFTESSNAYSYVVTGDTSAELKVIRGGAGGGGGASGEGYAGSGEFVSEVFDTGSENTYYYLLTWLETLPAGSNIEIQLRSGNSSNLSAETWVGPDGTAGTNFTEPNGEYIPGILQNRRYIQYRVLLTSDTTQTPQLENISISFQN